MARAAVAAAAIGAGGSYLSAQDQNRSINAANNTPQTSNTSGSSEGFTQNFVDPRFEPYIYGEGGILGSAYDWYDQNRSGTSPQSLEGMNNQWAQLGASKQGFDAMQNLGMGMMGQGVTGNPFSGGYQGGGTFPTTGIAPQNLTYTPAQFGQGGPFVPRQMQSFAAPGFGGGGGGGGEAAPGGTAINDAMNQILAGFNFSDALGGSSYVNNRTNEGGGRDERTSGSANDHWRDGGPGDGLGW